MFGGWYVVAVRDNVAALIFGPMKTQDEAAKLLDAAPATAEAMFTIERRETVRFAVGFFLTDQLELGRCNSKAWLTITKEKWSPS